MKKRKFIFYCCSIAFPILVSSKNTTLPIRENLAQCDKCETILKTNGVFIKCEVESHNKVYPDIFI